MKISGDTLQKSIKYRQHFCCSIPSLRVVWRLARGGAAQGSVWALYLVTQSDSRRQVTLCLCLGWDLSGKGSGYIGREELAPTRATRPSRVSAPSARGLQDRQCALPGYEACCLHRRWRALCHRVPPRLHECTSSGGRRGCDRQVGESPCP